MQKISLKIEGAFAIPVYRTIHAKRGDYLFISQTGAIKIVDGKTYQALKHISNEQDYILQKEKNLEKAKELFPSKDIMEQLLPSNGKLRQGIHNKIAYDKIYHALDWLVTHKKAEKITISNKKGDPQRLWAGIK